MKDHSHFLAALVLCAFCPPFSAAAQVDPVGWWRDTTETPDGEISTSLRLDYVDGELSGSFSNSYIDAQLPIFDSSLEGTKVEFKLQLRTRVLQYEGEIDGDSLTLLSRAVEGEPLPGVVTTITLKRSE